MFKRMPVLLAMSLALADPAWAQDTELPTDVFALNPGAPPRLRRVTAHLDAAGRQLRALLERAGRGTLTEAQSLRGLAGAAREVRAAIAPAAAWEPLEPGPEDPNLAWIRRHDGAALPDGLPVAASPR